ncbi:MAG: hypothetical protein ABIO38_05750, partial [Luteimonas sp.]
MNTTDLLIDQLAGHARPVRPLGSPLRRTVAWLFFSAAIVAAIVSVYGLRDGIETVFAVGPEMLEWLG